MATNNDLVHHEIMQTIAENIPPSSPSFKALTTASEPYLTKAAIDRCTEASDFVVELVEAGKVTIGKDYSVLKKMLDAATLVALRRQIEVLENKCEKGTPVNKTSEMTTNNELVHNKIMQTISEDIPPNTAYFRALKTASAPYLSKTAIARCTAGSDFVNELVTAGFVTKGTDYDVLTKMLHAAKLIALSRKIDDILETGKGSSDARDNTVPKERVSGEGASLNIENLSTKELKCSVDGGVREGDKAGPVDEGLAVGELQGTIKETLQTKIFRVVQNSDMIREWKNLGRGLGLSENNIIAIDHDNPLLKDKCYEMLIKWKQLRGHQGTARALCETLESLKYNDTAEAVKTCMLDAPLDD